MKRKDIGMIFVGVFSALYLLNPSGGIIEFVSDLVPFVGNIDEVAATTLLLGALGYFGIDVRGFFGNKFFTRGQKKEIKTIEMNSNDTKSGLQIVT